MPHSINSEGLKRRGFTPEQIRNLKNAYRVLYRSDLKLADAVAELTKRVTDAAGGSRPSSTSSASPTRSLVR